ncbi:glucans biosynthesis protein [Bradyrhizobium centrosematis]|uniref:HGGxSTG domain-containing protein n=2 Tax=Bradyrhizobium centrosematis TaxID=1300039 RepID=UPI00286E2DD1|nr:HGGxSTG domain-containing protein [Bradyrhizobium centrosematis]MCS3761084.1 glucans biosynthesis protein [Bradyrhizobium centrosematis]MCS3771028.1 glucans biosynthesis protein [Bradyrhizobium centrosematis]
MSAGHIRNTRAMAASPRCGAATRRGFACRAPAVCGKLRCRMHGGAPGSGAPWGNHNARKHGTFTQARIAERRATRELLDDAGKLLRELDSDSCSQSDIEA